MFKSKVNKVNFMVMCLAWSTTAFSYYMIGFYVKYIPGDVFTNVMVSSISELVFTYLSGVAA